MLTILWNSRNGMNAQQEKLDSISNNIVNVGTQGYKKVNVGFKDLVYEQLNRTGYPLSQDGKGERLNGTGVRATEWTREFSQGPLKPTDVKTDLAIEGEGFFKVQMPDGNFAYTRDGGFNPDSKGNLVTKQGYKLVIDGLDPNFKFDNNNFSVNENGDITTMVNGNGTKVGKINISNVDRQNSKSDDLQPLISIGENLYKPATGVNMMEVNDTSIAQGYVEMSNVDMGTEMTDMIITQRAFELSSKALKTADEMWGMINNLRGR